MTSIGLFVLLLALTTIDAQNECRDSYSANCINFSKCPAFLKIWEGSKPLTDEMVQILGDATCGFEDNERMICCTNQTMTRLSNSKTIPAPPNVTDHPNLRLLDHETCGLIRRTATTSTDHIDRQGIGGDRTGVYQFPWMALIAYDVGRANPEFYCGGTIISSRYILTAAHCIAELPGFIPIGVRVGDHDISKERDCYKDDKRPEIDCAERYQDFGVDNFHVHPQYPTSNLHNDIALIRLNGFVDFRATNVRPICLPFGTATTSLSRKAIVTGWGNTEPLGPRSRELLMAWFELISYEQCKEIYKPTVQIWHKQLCAGSESDVDSCLGDSGGPLQWFGLYNKESMRIVQYGVVSYTQKKCGTGVFTKVAYYMDWILNTMAD